VQQVDARKVCQQKRSIMSLNLPPDLFGSDRRLALVDRRGNKETRPAADLSGDDRFGWPGTNRLVMPVSRSAILRMSSSVGRRIIFLNQGLPAVKADTGRCARDLDRVGEASGRVSGYLRWEYCLNWRARQDSNLRLPT